MKKSFLLLLFCSTGVAIHSQSPPQQVIAVSGGEGGSGVNQIQWTVGEPVISTLQTGTAILTQGFQQPDLVVTAIQATDGLPFTVEAFPNPTWKVLMIRLTNTEYPGFQFNLYDINGTLLEQIVPDGTVTAVSMEDYPAGFYLLKVLQQGREINTFEIIKH